MLSLFPIEIINKVLLYLNINTIEQLKYVNKRYYTLFNNKNIKYDYIFKYYNHCVKKEKPEFLYRLCYDYVNSIYNNRIEKDFCETIIDLVVYSYDKGIDIIDSFDYNFSSLLNCLGSISYNKYYKNKYDSGYTKSDIFEKEKKMICYCFKYIIQKHNNRDDVFVEKIVFKFETSLLDLFYVIYGKYSLDCYDKRYNFYKNHDDAQKTISWFNEIKQKFKR